MAVAEKASPRKFIDDYQIIIKNLRQKKRGGANKLPGGKNG